MNLSDKTSQVLQAASEIVIDQNDQTDNLGLHKRDKENSKQKLKLYVSSVSPSFD